MAGQLLYNPRQRNSVVTGDTVLTAADFGKHITLDGSGSDYTLGFSAPSSLGEGWYCTVENADTSLNGGWWYITSECDGVSTSSINGYTASFCVHPREVREFYVHIGLLKSRVIRPFIMEYGFTVSFKMPSNYSCFSNTKLWGSGGSGGMLNGSSGSVSGGGGGACLPLEGVGCPASGTLVTATIASDTPGVTTQIYGNNGSYSTLVFDSIIYYAFGGGGGSYTTSTTASVSGGAGGGALSGPVVAGNTTYGGAPGGRSSGAITGQGLGGAGGLTAPTVNSSSSAWGGAAGSTSSGTVTYPGGDSVFGGPGGGGYSHNSGESLGGTRNWPAANGGAGGDSISGGDGVGYGAGGGGTRSGTKSGDGKGGAIIISAI